MKSHKEISKFLLSRFSHPHLSRVQNGKPAKCVYCLLLKETIINNEQVLPFSIIEIAIDDLGVGQDYFSQTAENILAISESRMSNFCKKITALVENADDEKISDYFNSSRATIEKYLRYLGQRQTQTFNEIQHLYLGKPLTPSDLIIITSKIIQNKKNNKCGYEKYDFHLLYSKDKQQSFVAYETVLGMNDYYPFFILPISSYIAIQIVNKNIKPFCLTIDIFNKMCLEYELKNNKGFLVAEKKETLDELLLYLGGSGGKKKKVVLLHTTFRNDYSKYSAPK